MQIQRYAVSQFEQLVDFIARLNPQPARHIGYFGIHRAEIVSTLKALNPPAEEGFVLAYADQRLIGVLGMECDPALGRAWLFGPLLDDDVPHAVADELYAALLPHIPAGIHEHELFCDADNIACQEFAARHAFPFHTEAAILYFTRDRLAGVPSVALPELNPAYHAQFSQLHPRLFPRTYASAQQIIDRPTDRTKVFVVTDDDRLLGYVAAKVDLEAGSGYTDYIGVDETARGQGLGRQLLAAVLHWMFSFPEVQQSDLTVITSNAPALRLYEGLGFQRERTMRGYRKAVEPA